MCKKIIPNSACRHRYGLSFLVLLTYCDAVVRIIFDVWWFDGCSGYWQFYKYCQVCRVIRVVLLGVLTVPSWLLYTQADNILETLACAFGVWAFTKFGKKSQPLDGDEVWYWKTMTMILMVVMFLSCFYNLLDLWVWWSSVFAVFNCGLFVVYAYTHCALRKLSPVVLDNMDEEAPVEVAKPPPGHTTLKARVEVAN